MDMQRSWTRFAVEAELADFGCGRLVAAHNAAVEDLSRRLAQCQEAFARLTTLYESEFGESAVDRPRWIDKALQANQPEPNRTKPTLTGPS